MDCAEMTCIGLVLTSFGEAMRDPVTVISWRGWGSVCVAAADCAEAGTASASKYLSDEEASASLSDESATPVSPSGDRSDTPAPSGVEGEFRGTTVTVFLSR